VRKIREKGWRAEDADRWKGAPPEAYTRRMLLAIGVMAALLAQEPPVLRWTMDGPVEGAQGRVEFIESPVGTGGKALYLNGVDAFVEAAAPAAAEWTFAAWVMPLEARAAPVASRGWTLDLGADGGARLSGIASAPGAVPAGLWTHVGAAFRGGKATLFVNGEPAGSGDLAPGDAAALVLGRGADGRTLFHGLVDDVRLYARALGAEEIGRAVDEGIPWLRPRPHAREPFAGKFELREGDGVAFAGGTNMVEMQEHGFLEALLARRGVRFRSLAWEGDTVYEQARMLNFGPWRHQLDRAGATVVVAQFGQLEALEGKEAIERFAASYEKLLEEFAGRTRRLVLLSPTPFERAAPPLPDLSARNGDLEAYVGAIRGIAARRQAVFVDLFTDLRNEKALTRNGLHLAEEGQRLAAAAAARQLGVSGAPQEGVREAVREKNRLWADYWRPMNHAFLRGDRTQVEFSRDPRDHRIRRFLAEMERFPSLIRRADERIEALLP
jgi:hypothetical protein